MWVQETVHIVLYHGHYLCHDHLLTEHLKNRYSGFNLEKKLGNLFHPVSRYFIHDVNISDMNNEALLLFSSVMPVIFSEFCDIRENKLNSKIQQSTTAWRSGRVWVHTCSQFELVQPVCSHVSMCGPVVTCRYLQRFSCQESLAGKVLAERFVLRDCCGSVKMAQPQLQKIPHKKPEWEQWVSRKEDVFLGMSAPFWYLGVSFWLEKQLGWRHRQISNIWKMQCQWPQFGKTVVLCNL